MISDLMKTIAEKPTAQPTMTYAESAAPLAVPVMQQQAAPTNGGSNDASRPPGSGGSDGRVVKKKRTLQVGKKSTENDTHPKVFGMKRVKRAEVFVTSC